MTRYPSDVIESYRHVVPEAAARYKFIFIIDERCRPTFEYRCFSLERLRVLMKDNDTSPFTRHWFDRKYEVRTFDGDVVMLYYQEQPK